MLTLCEKQNQKEFFFGVTGNISRIIPGPSMFWMKKVAGRKKARWKKSIEILDRFLPRARPKGLQKFRK